MPSRFLVGARFVCTWCHTRGVARCACKEHYRVSVDRGLFYEADLDDPANASLLAELVSVPRARGAPTGSELIWGGLRSKNQWFVSAALALAFLATQVNGWDWEKSHLIVAMFGMTTVLVRLPVLALELLLRLALGLIELLIALACTIAGKVTGSHRLAMAARDWLVRASCVFNGRYWWSRTTFQLRALPEGTYAEHAGTLSPSADLVVLISEGIHGRLDLSDAELPIFEVVLATGETIAVSVEAGALSLTRPTVEASASTAISPLFGETRAIRISATSNVVLRGGEWQSGDPPAGYRQQIEPRMLRGTPASPLEVVFRPSSSSFPERASGSQHRSCMAVTSRRRARV